MNIDGKYFILESDNRFPLVIPTTNWKSLAEYFPCTPDYTNISIYLLKANNRFYVGSDSRNVRPYEHQLDFKNRKHDNYYMQNVVNKYGLESFFYVKLVDIPKEYWDFRVEIENAYIKLFDTFHNGYNLAEFADIVCSNLKCRPKSEETRKKLSLANKGKKMPPRTEEYREKLSKVLKGKVKTAEHCRKISESKKGSHYSEEFREKRREYATGLTGENSTAGKEYTLISPDGELVTFKSMANFCKEHGLEKRTMFALLKGGRIKNGKFRKIGNVKGWTVPDNPTSDGDLHDRRIAEAKLVESCVK